MSTKLSYVKLSDEGIDLNPVVIKTLPNGIVQVHLLGSECRDN